MNKKNIRNKSILEINCGTGKDAIWLSNQGNDVIATDISGQMISTAKSKNNSITFFQMDINNINTDERLKDKKFDVIFSNFGGLNCLNPSELKDFLNHAKNRLTKEGELILVIMPKNCIWEKKYLFFTGKWSKIFRRNSQKPLEVNVDGKKVKTWYYNPKDLIKKVSKDDFSVDYKPVGFYIPPSYLENFFKNKIWLLNLFTSLENIIKNWSFLARYSDHFIISMKIK